MRHHTEIIDYFIDCQRRGVLSHAYLFVGSAGSGVSEVVSEVVHVLTPGEVISVVPQLPEKGKSTVLRIRVDQIRTLKEYLSGSSLKEGLRVVRMQETELMDEGAGNALLKVLEEAPAQTMFLIEVGSADVLLPTIISRCQVMRVGLVSDEVVNEILTTSGVTDEGERAECIQMCAGRAGFARMMATNKKVRTEWLKKWRALQEITRAPLAVQLKSGTKLDAIEELLLETVLHHDLQRADGGLQMKTGRVAGLMAARRAVSVNVPSATAFEQVWIGV